MGWGTRTLRTLPLAILLAAATSAPAGAAPGGLPSGIQPAAVADEPALPIPAGWPARDAFPRTSGTGRLVDGSLQWSDFLYDDHGAKGCDAQFCMPTEQPVAGLAPPRGTYRYAASDARRNGADIFRSGVAVDADFTYWRVDWNTLANPSLPLAVWVFDTDDNAATGAAAWPASANVRSAGIERALVVSATRWRLLNVASGAELAAGDTILDRDAQSFVVKLPRSALNASGTWRVRLGAGIAAADGRTFAAPPPGSQSFDPSAARLYNVAFRSVAQERFDMQFNFWMEVAQATALTDGDVSAFAARIDWARLAAGETEDEPLVKGYSNRWYVSSLDLGDGVQTDPMSLNLTSNAMTGDVRPNFLGRVQPYAVYVPTTYEHGKAAPLTWLLHSLALQHNQYGATAPKFLQQACEERGSICATTLGRGPDGWYHDEAELDFWEVWNRLAQDFTLDPDRTVLSGYSMGGYGTYKIGLEHPDLFAKAVVIAGPPMCGVRLSGSVATSPGASDGRCATDGDTAPLVENATWLPFSINHGAADELVPVSAVVEQVRRFDVQDLRHRFALYAAEDHMVWAVQDGFSAVAAQMGDGRLTRERDPNHFTYVVRPRLNRPDLGYGMTGAWWVQDIVPSAATPGSTAKVNVHSLADPHPSSQTRRTPGAASLEDPLQMVQVTTDASPALISEVEWIPGTETPEARDELRLNYTNVKSLTVDLGRAGFDPARGGEIHTNGGDSLTLELRGLGSAARVLVDGVPTTRADEAGIARVPVGSLAHVVRIQPVAPTALSLDVPASSRVTDVLTVRATLTSRGVPVAGQPVTLRVAGRALAATTDDHGVAAATLTLDADPGATTISAEFAETDSLLASGASAPFTVLAERTLLTYTGSTQARGELVPVQAQLFDDEGEPLPGRTVVFTAGSITATAVTDAAGRATATLLLPEHGRSQTIAISYAGAPRFEPAATSATVRWGS